MHNVEQTILWQYNDSPVLRQLIQNMNAYIDPRADIDQFYNLIWNVQTAEGYGLDVWGRIVGVSRVIKQIDGQMFGFAEPGLGVYLGFNQSSSPYTGGPFYNGNPITSNYTATDDEFRLMIYAKALANISDGSIKGMNQLLLNLFPGRGDCYVIDRPGGAVMTMAFYFSFPLQLFERSIVETSGIMPRPTGVYATVQVG